MQTQFIRNMNNHIFFLTKKNFAFIKSRNKRIDENKNNNATNIDVTSSLYEPAGVLDIYINFNDHKKKIAEVIKEKKRSTKRCFNQSSNFLVKFKSSLKTNIIHLP